MTKAKIKPKSSQIAVNRRARHEYTIEDTFEAGLVLLGWEVKSLRAGRVQIAESYVLIKDGEVWLFGAQINPLTTASTHVDTDAARTRKLLLHNKEIVKLMGAVQRKGYTVIPLKLYWKKNKVKLEIALGVGKKLHDKRATLKERDWQREKEKLRKVR